MDRKINEPKSHRGKTPPAVSNRNGIKQDWSTLAQPLLIKADGTREFITVRSKRLSLQAIQQAVGGYSELLPFRKGNCILVNEDGKQLGLPPNKDASELVGYPIVGDVLIVPMRFM